jgi:hypothetical protein
MTSHDFRSDRRRRPGFPPAAHGRKRGPLTLAGSPVGAGTIRPTTKGIVNATQPTST